MSKYDLRKKRGDNTDPYSFQNKTVLRYIKHLYPGRDRMSAIIVYCTICWIASDFSKDDPEHNVKNWPKTIATYSGIGMGTAQKHVREFVRYGLVLYPRTRNPNGRWDNRAIIIPAEIPQRAIELATERRKAKSGSTNTGEVNTL